MKTQRGFTLVEMVVSIGIFLIVSVVLVDIYLLVSRTQGSLRGNAGIMNETARVVDEMVLSLRAGRIAYERYPQGEPLPADTLHIADQFGKQITWRVAAVGVDGCIDAPCLQRWTEATGWANILRGGLRMRRASFAVSPEVPGTEQPRVTILIDLQPVTAGVHDDAASLPLQVTVSPRYYER
ncbi:MAG: type II secretion system protein [bacterium]|nr:type II secretion system protein [bacterium]